MVTYEKRGRIAIFILDRPEARNAMNAQGMHELHDRMLEFDNDQDLSK